MFKEIRRREKCEQEVPRGQKEIERERERGTSTSPTPYSAI
jgi:hypothetical protein